MPGEVPRRFLFSAGGDDVAKELSIFVDESGDRGGKSRYYLIALVFHDQADEVTEQVAEYERRLDECGLPDIPFHSEPLLNGHKDYENLDLETRKSSSFLFPPSFAACRSATRPSPIAEASSWTPRSFPPA